MVRSERTIGGFFHQCVRERVEALEEGRPLGGGERAQRALERAVAALEPRAHALGRERVQVDDGAAAVVCVLAAVNERAVLEVAGQLARGRERQPELARELADGALSLGADVSEHRHVPAGEPRAGADERQQVVARAPALPEAAHDPAQHPAELVELPAVAYHCALVIIE
jgi:hypothetical protein